MSLPTRCSRRSAFTLAELIVVIVILAILVSIFVPYLMNLREVSRRTSCANNLRQMFGALQLYAKDNGALFPSVRKDAANPGAYVAFSGPDDADPFAANSAVKPNDVTASLWLLVRGGYVKDTGVFICPSVVAQRDLIQDPTGRSVSAAARGNFRRGLNLSYSYASPFSAASEYKLTENLPSAFAILADKNPGVDVDVPFGAPIAAHARINSLNHGGAGQNVLYTYGGVTFQATPYCATGNDNIYTAQSPAPPTTGPTTTSTTVPGSVSRGQGPSTPSDSYLLPTEHDGD